MAFSRKQIIQIERHVAKAFRSHDELDLLDLPGDLDGEAMTTRREFWRKRELASVTGKDSYSDCNARGQYLPVLSHFQALSGDSEGAEKTRQRQEWGSPATGDAATYIRQIEEACKAVGWSVGYAVVIAKQKFGQPDFKQLSTTQLSQLCFTVLNRANAKLDKGDPENRNKKQRRARRK